MNKKQDLPFAPVYWVLIFICSTLICYSLVSAYFGSRPLDRMSVIIACGGLVIYAGRKRCNYNNK